MTKKNEEVEILGSSQSVKRGRLLECSLKIMCFVLCLAKKNVWNLFQVCIQKKRIEQNECILKNASYSDYDNILMLLTDNLKKKLFRNCMMIPLSNNQKSFSVAAQV